MRATREGSTIRRPTIGLLLGLGLFVASPLPTQAAAPAQSTLARSDTTPGLQHADKLRHSDPNRQLTIGVSLAPRNQPQLDRFIAQVSDRKSPSYGHYLTPTQFAANYGPTQTQIQPVVDHLRASGLVVGSVSSNGTIVEATGSLAAVETAFGVTISDWHDRDQNRDFYGNDSQPTLPASLASYVVGVAGLNNHYPLHRLGPSPKAPPGGGPAGGYTPNDLKKAYDVTPLASAGYNGSGQPLGLFELDGFRQSNITVYDTQYALGSPAPTRVLISGGPGPLGSGEIEVELDIEVMHAIAPASPITVWEGPNSDPGANATYNAMVTSNTTKSNSTSWGICEPNTTSAEMTTLDNIFKQAAAQGQSFFAASGDNGAYDCGDTRLTVDSPANDPYMTGTGGTNLSLNADSSYKSESAWSNPNTLIGTGGGLSGYFARPSWQTGPGVANTYSNGKRQIPDVALDADPQTGYSVYVTYQGVTGWNVVGGTSAAAPSWAGFTGVYNQYAAAKGAPTLGYANPTLYSMGSIPQTFAPYHDIAAGDNLYYPATLNWDYATGWGSYDGYNFARELSGPRTISGSVHDASGVAVGNTRISVAQGGSGTSCCTWVINAASDAAGTFSVNVPSGTYKLYLTPPGYPAQWYGGADFATATPVVVSGNVPVDISLSPVLSGSVHDASGSAVGNTRISVAQGGSGTTCCTWVINSTSDAAGTFSISVPAGTYKLYLTPPGSPTQWYRGQDFASATPVVVSGNVAVAVFLGPVVSGSVHDAGGASVGNTRISVAQGGSGTSCCTWVINATSDAAGNFSINVPAGTYKLYLTPPGYAAQWYKGQDFASTTPVVVSGNVTVVISLSPVISGSVRDASGVVVGNTRISVAQGGSGMSCCTWVINATSDAAGNFSINVPAGTYRLYLTPPGYPAQWYGGTDFASATPVVMSGNITVAISLSPVLTGSVHDAGGAAVGNTRISVAQGGPGASCCTWVINATSNAAGSFGLSLPAGTYKLYLTPPGYPAQWYGGPDFASATPVVVSGNVNVNITVHA